VNTEHITKYNIVIAVITGSRQLALRTRSHELAFYALARGRQVGLDMEYFRENLEAGLAITRCSFNARV